MLPTRALQQIATVAAGVSGLRDAQYPATGQTPKYPGLVLLWGETTIQYQSTEQYWDMTVRGLLLTGLVNETKHHVAEVDPLIAAIVDRFSAEANLDGFLLVTPDGDRTDGCLVTSVSPAQEIVYGGQQHYGATLTFNVQMRRFAGS